MVGFKKSFKVEVDVCTETKAAWGGVNSEKVRDTEGFGKERADYWGKGVEFKALRGQEDGGWE